MFLLTYQCTFYTPQALLVVYKKYTDMLKETPKRYFFFALIENI